MLEDDELAELLADEDRVREALMAAVDVQQVPPVRTDLALIVERGRRRARMQVLAATMAAVVLIAGIAIGATALGRLSGLGKVATAAGQPSLPVTTQLSTPVPAPATPTIVVSGVCAFPDPIGGTGGKWMSPTAGQEQLLQQQLASMAANTYLKVKVADPIPTTLQQAGGGVYGVHVVFANQLNGTITLQRSEFTGRPADAAGTDVKKYMTAGDKCTGTAAHVDVGSGMVANLLTAGMDAGIVFQRVQLYTTRGERLDITEMIDSTVGGATATGQSTPPTPPTASGHTALLTDGQLLSLAIRVSSVPGG